MKMFRLEVYPDSGYRKQTTLIEAPNIDEAERIGGMTRDRIDPSAMYEVTELYGISKKLAERAVRRHKYLIGQ